MSQQPNKKTTSTVVDALNVMVGEHSLMMPMSAVAEVVRGIKVSSRKGDPQWLHGWLTWRDTEIPLVAFEMLAGGNKAAHSGTVNALVVNTLGRAKQLGFYALLLADLPQPARVTDESDFVASSKQDKKNEYLLMNVQLGGTESVIPNLEAVEKFIRAKL